MSENGEKCSENSYKVEELQHPRDVSERYKTSGAALWKVMSRLTNALATGSGV